MTTLSSWEHVCEKNGGISCRPLKFALTLQLGPKKLFSGLFRLSRFLVTYGNTSISVLSVLVLSEPP
ncbi:hypothetical protein PM082_024388 [Marasmius tenuissimus]|nr:hypothetical protein PM082_024388 [Marasmius tenuissimus]